MSKIVHKIIFRAPLPEKAKKFVVEKPLKLSRISSFKSLEKLSKKKEKEEKKKEKEEKKKAGKKVKAGKRGRKKKESNSGPSSKPEVVKNGNNKNAGSWSKEIETSVVPIQSSEAKETKSEPSNDFHFLCTICKSLILVEKLAEINFSSSQIFFTKFW